MFKLADDLNLPENAITQTFALLGRRGSGKSYAGGKLAELFLDGGHQVVIVDPVGVWYGLRHDARGNAAGIPIPIFGGQHGDIPLEATAGALVAQLVAVNRTSVVLDVSGFTGADQRRFVADFATELLHLKKANRSPLMTIWDESQEFVPQHVRPDHARMVGAMEKLVKLGRNFGVGCTLLSQRPQAVNKDVLNQTEVLVVFQLTGPQERKVIEGWVSDNGFGKDELAQIPRLQPGHAFLWSPQWLGTFKRIRIEKKRTFDASATPEAGDTVAAGRMAPIDLGAVRTAMAATIEEAKANDPKALREEIARLRAGANAGGAAEERDELRRQVESFRHRDETQLRGLDAIAAQRDALQGHVAALVDMRDSVLRDLEKSAKDLGEIAASWRRHASTLDHAISSAPALAAPPSPPAMDRVGSTWAPRPRPPSETPPTTNGTPDGDGAARILRALVSTAPRPLTRAQVGVLAVIKPSGGSFGTYISRLAVKGHISRDGGLLSVTEAGKAAATGRLPAARELVAEWGEKLGGKTREILVLMTDGQERTKAQIADEVGVEVNGGSFGTYISRLKANGLIEKTQRGFTVSSFLRLR